MVGWYVLSNCLLHREPTSFCSSLVKSEPAWLSPKKLKLEPPKSTFAAQLVIEKKEKNRKKGKTCNQKNVHIICVFMEHSMTLLSQNKARQMYLVLSDAVIHATVVQVQQHAAEGDIRSRVSLCIELHRVPTEVFATVDAQSHLSTRWQQSNCPEKTYSNFPNDH